MENPCYKCGQSVEEGIPFCLHCSAPQIRVLIAEPAASMPGAVAIPQEGNGFPQLVSMPAVSARWSGALKACILAAVVAVVLGFLSQLLIVALLAAGFLAVVFHRRFRPGIPLTALDGAKFGALAGILCCVILSVLIGLAITDPDTKAKLQEQYVAGAQRVATWFPDSPEIRAQIEELKTPQGFSNSLIGAGISFMLLSILLSGIGGAVGGVVFRRRDKG
jgi:hypothetical protein